MEETAEQTNSRPWLFKKGQSGNPSGRPKGSISLKEYARKYLKNLSEEEKLEFMEGLSKDVVWKMAEGNPKNDIEHSGTLNISKVLDDLDGNNTQNASNGEISSTESESPEGQTMENEPPLQD